MRQVPCTWSPVRFGAGMLEGAENSGVALVLGLHPEHACQPGKRKAVGFGLGRMRQGWVRCVSRRWEDGAVLVGGAGGGRSTVGTGWQTGPL